MHAIAPPRLTQRNGNAIRFFFGTGCRARAPAKSAEDTAVGKECVACHQEQTPGMVGEWKKSAHFANSVDCYDCHKAKEGDKDAFRHKRGLHPHGDLAEHLRHLPHGRDARAGRHA